MTPEITADNEVKPTKIAPSTAGMTSKVVKGSMWTLAGSVTPLAVSFISIPFVIRFLGTESYGVLLLVGLIPTYFAFADFGMGFASTKFASEAYGQGDERREAEIIWTATAIAAISALMVAVLIFLFSYRIVALLNVPDHLLSQANIALKITSGSFFLGILSSVLNSPMLARLRMDLNMLTSAIPKILLAVVTPFILYFGGGIVEAVGWAFIISAGTLAVIVCFSTRLLPPLTSTAGNRDLVQPLIKFGGAWLVAMIAAMLVTNLEKVFLTKLVSVTALAYYSVAGAFANIATMFSQGMIQSLIPAFSQLQTSEKRAEFDALFARGMRLNCILLIPGLAVLVVIAKPFFTLWAGSEFGEESSVPFYLLTIGLFFNIFAYIPHSTLLAQGRTDIFAKLYWFELFLYAAGSLVLIKYFGIMGAAAAWSLRVTVDALIVLWLSRRVGRMPFGFLRRASGLVLGSTFLLPPILFAVFYSNYTLWLAPTMFIALALYAATVWKLFVEADERIWIKSRMQSLLGNAG